MKITITCIGSGNMGTALMRGAATGLDPENIRFADAEGHKAEEAARALGAGICHSNREAAAEGNYIFLAVKPQVLEEVLKEIAPVVQQRLADGHPLALVSMAAGWPIKRIQAYFAGAAMPPVVRIMPNTPALVSAGLIAVSPSPEVSSNQVAELERILSGAGIVDFIEEQYLDGVTALSGSGPAYVCLFIEALADGGVRAGLPRDKALRYAAQTALGSAKMLLETGRHPGELKDMVASPGGTTIAGIAALENGSFRGTVMSAVEAAYRRALELST